MSRRTIGGTVDYAKLSSTVDNKMARYAQRYCELGLVLTHTLPRMKGPRHAGWNLRENAITSPAAALAFWTEHFNHGIGALLSYSGLVSLDVDHEEHSRSVLAHLGIDLNELAARTPCIVGRPGRFRLMFRAPTVELKHRCVAWPKTDKPRESFVVFELRAGAVSDALPPTIHAETGQPYRWAIPPRDGFPVLPDRLLDLWINWKATEQQALSVCPWWTSLPPRPATVTRLPPTGESVIDKFNAAHDIATILAANGYVERGHNRFAPANSQHAAGVVVVDGRAFCHHAGDPLFDSEKRPRDAFDVWCHLEHGGDMHKAVRSAAELLGMRRESRA